MVIECSVDLRDVQVSERRDGVRLREGSILELGAGIC